MSKDIDVDIEELGRFINTLRTFQTQVSDEFKALEFAWQKCDQSWQGDSKERFTKDFEVTTRSVDSALDAGKDAVDWLNRFYEIVKEFEGY